MVSPPDGDLGGRQGPIWAIGLKVSQDRPDRNQTLTRRDW